MEVPLSSGITSFYHKNVYDVRILCRQKSD